ncbi:MAG: DNA polymerase III subunit gamma/tau [Lachnospiraceae bacterium]|nr:DNA polymerase III subunit gamma/tau [Lachnospiraceae bacterium]
MSYVALYRKFRPDSFDEVKGQEPIVQALRNQILYDHVGHAYLFCGTRGTGKTTLAKLLAKTVNCEHPVNGNPCGECESCKAVASGRSTNVIEIDAASNNGVDNVRRINEAVQYSPASGKYLVYIIDEAHMMSPGAFNALLKTLEEPPAHVIFILATTNDQKIPITIQSRCQRYNFHRISVETIAARLSDLMKRENVDVEEEAIRYIARAADGSMRDGLSILDECISSSLGEKLTFENVLRTVGAVDIDVYVKLIRALQNEDVEAILDLINESVWQGRDLTKYVDDFIWFLRNMYFLKLSPNLAEELDLTKEDASIVASLGEEVGTKTITWYIQQMQALSADIRYSTIKRVTLEMGMLKLMHPETEQNFISLASRLEKLEAKAARVDADMKNIKANGVVVSSASANGIAASSVESSMSPEEESKAIQENLKAKYPPAVYEELIALAQDWKSKVIYSIQKPARDFLMDASIAPDENFKDQNDVPSLKLVYTYPANAHAPKGLVYYENPKNLERLENMVSELIQKQVHFKVEARKTGSADGIDMQFDALNKIHFDDIVIEDE